MEKSIKGGTVVNKTGLVKSLAEKTGVTQKDAAKVLDSVLESIQSALAQGEKVQIIGNSQSRYRTRNKETADRKKSAVSFCTYFKK